MAAHPIAQHSVDLGWRPTAPALVIFRFDGAAALELNGAEVLLSISVTDNLSDCVLKDHVDVSSQSKPSPQNGTKASSVRPIIMRSPLLMSMGWSTGALFKRTRFAFPPCWILKLRL